MLLVIAASAPVVADAGPGIYLSWNDCPLSSARITRSWSRLPSRWREAAAGVGEYAARLVCQKGAAYECPGCDVATCLLLNSIHLVRITGGSADPVLVAPGIPGANRGTWQGSG